jgi:thiamine-phosphate pyrophosphorylase
LFAKVDSVMRGGCRVLQYRHKTASAAYRKREVESLRALCQRYQSVLIINDDIELAHQIDADGVHLGQTDTSVREARQRLGQQKIIGVSCHDSLEMALEAEQQGASYVAFGRFFDSRTKPDAPPADIGILQRAKQQLRIPVVAIGGITRDNAPRVIKESADMVAVIHDLFATDDLDQVEQRAKFFTQLFR